MAPKQLTDPALLDAEILPRQAPARIFSLFTNISFKALLFLVVIAPLA
jgi:hypothetical protein